MASIARASFLKKAGKFAFKASAVSAVRGMAGLSGSVIELSSYLEKRISQKSAEYAAVNSLNNKINF